MGPLGGFGTVLGQLLALMRALKPRGKAHMAKAMAHEAQVGVDRVPRDSKGFAGLKSRHVPNRLSNIFKDDKK